MSIFVKDNFFIDIQEVKVHDKIYTMDDFKDIKNK